MQSSQISITGINPNPDTYCLATPKLLASPCDNRLAKAFDSQLEQQHWGVGKFANWRNRLNKAWTACSFEQKKG